MRTLPHVTPRPAARDKRGPPGARPVAATKPCSPLPCSRIGRGLHPPLPSHRFIVRQPPSSRWRLLRRVLPCVSRCPRHGPAAIGRPGVPELAWLPRQHQLDAPRRERAAIPIGADPSTGRFTWAAVDTSRFALISTRQKMDSTLLPAKDSSSGLTGGRDHAGPSRPALFYKL